MAAMETEVIAIVLIAQDQKSIALAYSLWELTAYCLKIGTLELVKRFSGQGSLRNWPPGS